MNVKKQTLDIFQLRVNVVDKDKTGPWCSKKIKVKVLCLKGYIAAGQDLINGLGLVGQLKDMHRGAIRLDVFAHYSTSVGFGPVAPFRKRSASMANTGGQKEFNTLAVSPHNTQYEDLSSAFSHRGGIIPTTSQCTDQTECPSLTEELPTAEMFLPEIELPGSLKN
ncbi:hypothetical protein Q8A73_019936 [Channa argus]|nr:hypothetical protein Q8A73_019936 [Channa argus]